MPYQAVFPQWAVHKKGRKVFLPLTTIGFRDKKFWEELIVYFRFIATWMSDTISRNKSLVCVRNEANKTIQFGRLHCWYFWWEWFIKYTIEMASGGMLYIPSLMTIVSGIPVILRVLRQQFESLQCWHYWRKGFMMYAIEMASVAWYIRTKFHEDWHRRSNNIKVCLRNYWWEGFMNYAVEMGSSAYQVSITLVQPFKS
jgi:hypothetical protein